MNRKDFELVARVLKEDCHARVAVAFADAFSKSAQCAGFDRIKFLRAAGLPFEGVGSTNAAP